MEEWLQKQNKLKTQLDTTRQKVESKLQECKQSYKLQLDEISRQKELDIKDLQKRYKDLSWQKDIQEKQNRQATIKLEHYHFDEVKELEDLYSNKLTLEGSAYLKLEQEGLELKQAYEKRIADIKLSNEKAIRKLVDEFKVNLMKV